jgi:hypothetical protein
LGQTLPSEGGVFTITGIPDPAVSYTTISLGTQTLVNDTASISVSYPGGNVFLQLTNGTAGPYQYNPTIRVIVYRNGVAIASSPDLDVTYTGSYFFENEIQWDAVSYYIPSFNLTGDYNEPGGSVTYTCRIYANWPYSGEAGSNQLAYGGSSSAVTLQLEQAGAGSVQAHTHGWGDISSPPVYTTRWPTWTEVTSKPTTFTPSSHSITSHTASASRIFYSNGSGTITELLLGASGTYLKSNGTGAAPSWDSPSGGASTTLSALTDTTISSPGTGQVLYYNGSSWVNSYLSYVPTSGASYIQSSGRSSSWSSSNGTSTGAINAIMGTSTSATWLWSGTSNGTFRAGFQMLDQGGEGRLYIGSAAFQFNGSTGFTSPNNITAYSDEKLKKDILTIDNALEKVNKLRGVYFIRKDDESNRRQIGVIAQEVQQVLPEVVFDNGEVLSVDYGNIVSLLIEAIKELQEKVKGDK